MGFSSALALPLIMGALGGKGAEGPPHGLQGNCTGSWGAGPRGLSTSTSGPFPTSIFGCDLRVLHTTQLVVFGICGCVSARVLCVSGVRCLGEG